jgi:membrane fusion protein, multidrug efflux system
VSGLNGPLRAAGEVYGQLSSIRDDDQPPCRHQQPARRTRSPGHGTRRADGSLVHACRCYILVDAARQQVAAAKAQATTDEAEVQQAQAQVRQAQLNLSYTKLYAPEDGRVTQKNVEPGNFVQTGQALCAIVPHRVWVVANFKETQLTYMQPGQAAEITVDTYPHHPFRQFANRAPPR